MPTHSDDVAAKRELRVTAIARRRAMSPADLTQARAANTAHLVAACLARGIGQMAAYEPFGTEPASARTLEAVAAVVRSLIVPVVLPDNDLDWRSWDASGGGLGVDRIGLCDLIVVPALLVDRRGIRLGRGGGSYDRALTRIRAGAAVVALLYEGELVDRLPAQPWDVPVDAVITPVNGWQDLRS